MKHYFTIDVEDWYQVYYARPLAETHTWKGMKPQIEPMLKTSLELLAKHKVTATFFIVGYLAKEHGALIRKISEAGHEVASHGYWHDECHAFTDAQLKDDIFQSKTVLEDAIGKAVIGYRAPGFSIHRLDHQAIDMVREAGYKYDSSLLGKSSHAYYVRPGLVEVPPNAAYFLGRNWPVNGGCFFRMLPYSLYRPYVQRLERKQEPLNFYIHSWELYKEYPRLPLGLAKRFIQYANLGSVHGKVDQLLKEFSFTSIERRYDFSSEDPLDSNSRSQSSSMSSAHKP